MNLKLAMELAGHNMIGMLCADRQYLPYFNLEVGLHGEARLNFHKGFAHNVCRWWDTMLRLEHTIGFEIPAHIEAACLENMRWCFDNPDQLMLQPLDVKYRKSDGRPHLPEFELHSGREAMMALDVHVRYRANRWAARQGRRTLEKISQIFRDDGTWDYDACDYVKHLEDRPRVQHSTTTHGRTLEGIVLFYQATGDPLAMEVADRIARYHLNHTIQDDGGMDAEDTPTHTHSYLGTLRGLLMFGELTHQRQYIDAVDQTYRNAVLNRIIKPSGWTNHDIDRETKPETASGGDVAQLALWLSRNGCSDLLDNVERIVRARMLPSLVTEKLDLHLLGEAQGDEADRLGERFMGALGGCHHRPHGGKISTTDVTAAVLHTFCDIYEHIAVRRPAGLTVQFHFDYDDAHVRITSKRDDKATVTVEPRVPQNVLIRVPAWAPPQSLKFTTAGERILPLMLGNFAFFDRSRLQAPLIMTYDLPEHTTEETIDGTTYTCHWRGDEITGVHPNTDYFPFYPTAG